MRFVKILNTVPLSIMKINANKMNVYLITVCVIIEYFIYEFFYIILDQHSYYSD